MTFDKKLSEEGADWIAEMVSDDLGGFIPAELVDLVILPPRSEDPPPRAYVLLRPRELKPLLIAIRQAAAGAGENEATLASIDAIAESVDGRPGDYFMFGFDPWTG